MGVAGLGTIENSWCEVHPHPECRICGVQVGRRTPHSHYYARGRIEHVLCSECIAIQAKAALPVLGAAERAGIECDLASITRWLDSGNAAVLVTRALPLDL